MQQRHMLLLLSVAVSLVSIPALAQDLESDRLTLGPKVGSLPRLRTLDGIEALGQLKSVAVYWPNCVEETEALLDLPALRTVATFGIDPKHPTWQSLKEAAGARRIAVRLIG